MAQRPTVTEVARRFAEYIDRVSDRGESFVLTRGNKPVAELRPLPTGKKLSELPSLLASLPHLSPTEATQFADWPCPGLVDRLVKLPVPSARSLLVSGSRGSSGDVADCRTPR